MASYQVEVSSQVRKEIRQLPGNVRQRAIRTLQALRQEPRPHNSRPLAKVELKPGTELRRIRIATWRIVYLVEEDLAFISVLAIRRRPPYQYDDLDELMKSL